MLQPKLVDSLGWVPDWPKAQTISGNQEWLLPDLMSIDKLD